MPKPKDRKLKAVTDEAPKEPKGPKTRPLKLNDRQKELLLDADRTVALAQERLSLVFAGICAAAGVPDGAQLVRLEKNTLTVQLPEQA
jgi:hypothetical protein